MSQSEGPPCSDSLGNSGNEQQLFLYETKRAAILHERMSQLMKRPDLPSNSNTGNNWNQRYGGIKNVQMHKSAFGKETGVETDLQSCGPATDLNIKIIMDSDSNVSNAIGNSFEYESLDPQVASDKTPTPAHSSMEGAVGEEVGWQSGEQQQAAGGSGKSKESDAFPRASNAEDNDLETAGDEEGEGEGEGDLDDALKHYRRYLDGEKIDILRGPSKEDDTRETLKKLPTGHLGKEGVVIGYMSVFADVHVKEFIVMLSDEMIQGFLVDPERFRSVANRTKCEIEVTRRILNRRMGGYHWLKYLVVVIRGPTFSSIDQCDKMMSMLFPPYKRRKPYGRPSCVTMFLRENIPDNADLYFNYQRTGPCQKMFGEIPLMAPFRRTKSHRVEQTPWKLAVQRQQWGMLEPRNGKAERALSHVYPERGGASTAAMDHSIKWADAADQAVVMSKAKDLARSQMISLRRTESAPLYALVIGE